MLTFDVGFNEFSILINGTNGAEALNGEEDFALEVFVFDLLIAVKGLFEVFIFELSALVGVGVVLFEHKIELRRKCK